MLEEESDEEDSADPPLDPHTDEDESMLSQEHPPEDALGQEDPMGQEDPEADRPMQSAEEAGDESNSEA